MSDIVKTAMMGNLQIGQQFGSAFETGMKIAQAAEQARMDNAIKQEQLKLSKEQIDNQLEEKATDLLKLAFDDKTNNKFRKDLIDRADVMYQRSGRAPPMSEDFKKLALYDPNLGKKIAELAEKKKQAALDPNSRQKAEEYKAYFDNILQSGIADVGMITGMVNESLKTDISLIGPLTKREEKANVISNLKSRADTILNKVMSGDSDYIPDEKSMETIERIRQLSDGADIKDPKVKATIDMAIKDLQRDEIKIAEGSIQKKRDERLNLAKEKVFTTLNDLPSTAPIHLRSMAQKLMQRLSDTNEFKDVAGPIMKEAIELKNLSKAIAENREDEKESGKFTEKFITDVNKISESTSKLRAGINNLKFAIKTGKIKSLESITPTLARVWGMEVGNLSGNEQTAQSMISTYESILQGAKSLMGDANTMKANQGTLNAYIERLDAMDRSVSNETSLAFEALNSNYKADASTGNRFLRKSYDGVISPRIKNEAIRFGHYIKGGEVWKSLTFDQKVKAFAKKNNVSEKIARESLQEAMKGGGGQ